MTEANLAAHEGNEWMPFWRNLKEAYDVFERTRIPPKVSVCNRRYIVADGALDDKTAKPADAGKRLTNLARPATSYCVRHPLGRPTGSRASFARLCTPDISAPSASSLCKVGTRDDRLGLARLRERMTVPGPSKFGSGKARRHGRMRVLPCRRPPM
jgi:hypothetical protein